MAEQQQDVDSLKRRGRRRLVGAVALVLLAVIVLPMVFDPEPRSTVPPVSVRIPGEDESAFSPKGSKPAVKAPEPLPAETKPVPPRASEEKQQAGTKRAGSAKAAATQNEFVVPVGAFANPDGVIARLAAAKVPYYTEAAPGNLTRVRAGPFATRDAAEKAASRLKGLGLQPGAVATRTG